MGENWDIASAINVNSRQALFYSLQYKPTSDKVYFTMSITLQEFKYALYVAKHGSWLNCVTHRKFLHLTVRIEVTARLKI